MLVFFFFLITQIYYLTHSTMGLTGLKWRLCSFCILSGRLCFLPFPRTALLLAFSPRLFSHACSGWRGLFEKNWECPLSKSQQITEASVQQPMRNWILPTTTELSWKWILPWLSLEINAALDNILWLQPFERPWADTLIIVLWQTLKPRT